MPLDVAWIAGPAGSLRIAERADEAGEEGLAVVLVHDLGGRLEHWEALLSAPARGLRRIAVDLPGHGESDPPADREATVDVLAASLGAVLDGLGLRRAALVGHGLGALAAVAFAGRRPGRVAALVLVDPNGDQTRLPTDEVAAGVEAVRRDPAGELRAWSELALGDAAAGVRARVLADLATVAPELLASLVASAAAYSPLADLARFPGRALAVTSELNRTAISLPRLRPQLAEHAFAHDGHWLPLDRPDELAAVLAAFLAEVAG